MPSFSRLSLLWKILLSTSVAITVLFALTGWIVLRTAVETTTSTMEDEVGASFQAYQSLWEARAELLASVSLTLSQMSDVRAAFGTRDAATIRDTANELWKKLAVKGKSKPCLVACAPSPTSTVRTPTCEDSPSGRPSTRHCREPRRT